MKRPERERLCHARHGSAYLIVLSTAIIVSLLSLAGIMTVQVHRRRTENADHIQQARLFAQAGLELAMQHLEDDPAWRQKAAQGQWETDTAIGDGFVGIAFSDPEDGDVYGPLSSNDYQYHPVVLTATGKCGPSVQQVRLRMDFSRIGVQALRSSMHTAGNISLKGVAAHSDHVFTAEGNIVAEDDGSIVSQVHTDVAANGSVEAKGSSQFLGATDLAVEWPLTMPDPNTVFDYYLANGTHININDIPLWGGQLLVNPSMEGPLPNLPTTGWQAYGDCLWCAYLIKKKDGLCSLAATGRQTVNAGPSQDITNKLASGVPYHVLVNAGFVSGTSSNGRLVVEYVSSVEGVKTWASGWVLLEAGKFKVLQSASEIRSTDYVPAHLDGIPAFRPPARGNADVAEQPHDRRRLDGRNSALPGDHSRQFIER